ncbi:hypothetical protein EVAR_97642_1 [Eumeta japonica]|uniref:Helitron helicase-like domain-containing protein n=1 Tax=Eumeta variegata TaxID=151549 RepID=A0A4C1WYH9_EUMVA|nr:hypothetical protein EVAR_97642_1 [Eumeta japonica]
MIRQFGVPTLFMTISAAETQWPHLIKQLKSTVDKEEVSLEESQNIPYAEKCDSFSPTHLYALLFETRYKELKKWLSPVGPFGKLKINHQYHRIEFQNRGSPHAHMMLWIEDAPIFIPGDQSSTEKVIMFVDQIISCNSEDLDEDLVKIQTHKHTFMSSQPSRPCRFGIPFSNG